MALGVSSLIVVLSVMNGLAGELTGRLLKAVPHLEVRSVAAASNVIETTELNGLTFNPYIRRQLMPRRLLILWSRADRRRCNESGAFLNDRSGG